MEVVPPLRLGECIEEEIMKPITKLAATLALGLAATPALCQDYPTKPIDVIVPLSAGGLGDLNVRTATEIMSNLLGQPFVIENRPGAGAVVGISAAKNAEPDGYTILVPPASGFSINPNLRELPYDPVADFDAICRLGGAPSVLVANPSVGIRNLDEFIARAAKGELLFASAGPGTPSHLAQELLKMEMTGKGAGNSFVHVPYKGTAQAVTDAIGGHAEALFESPGPLIGGIQAGQLVPIAVTSPERLKALPDVPTFIELGYTGVELIGWIGMAAPKGTPAPVIKALGDACETAVKSEKFTKFSEDNGLLVFFAGPEEFGPWIEEQIGHYGKIVKAAGLGEG